MRENKIWPKKIIHIDMDAFFAAVEQRDHPEYRGKPVVVGGDPFGRGVVSTASYEARPFGVRSAMPAAQARKLCPQAIFLRPNFRKYAQVSAEIMGVLRQHTDLVEPVSLDEAYLDVTENRFRIEDPAMIASLIKQNIYAVTRLTASAGVASNLFLAKISSDFKKPDGLTLILPGNEIDFLKELPVRKIPGVGPVTEAQLNKLGIKTCAQLRDSGLPFLIRHFGKTGVFLFERANGRDERIVEPGVPSKQYSSEETFEKDVLDKDFMKETLADFSREVFEGLKREGRMGRTIVLKVKYHDFEVITRSRTIAYFPKDSNEVFGIAWELLEKKTDAGRRPVRLLGLGISGLHEEAETADPRQPELF